MVEITTKFDTYIKTLLRKLDMLWIVTLNDGTEVYSDDERLSENPWTRLKKYMDMTGKYAVKVRSLAFGAPENVMLENPNGLNGFFIKRGVVKDVVLEGEGDIIQFRRLICGLYNPNTNMIDVNVFSWPEGDVFTSNQPRLPSIENIELMYFMDKNLEQKLRSEQTL